VVFPLKPIYDQQGIQFIQAFATEIHPEGDAGDGTPYVMANPTDGSGGDPIKVPYDYLLNATGPKLNFGATPGLGPQGGNTVSVCTADHAVEASEKFDEVIAKLKKGQPQRLVIGTGHGTCTCEGAAFEYTFNVEHILRQKGVRDKAEVIYLTNEAQLGDFGVGGMIFTQQGYETTSKVWTESLFRERGVHAILGAHCTNIEANKVTYEQLDGSIHELDFDFAMLLPPFKGQDLKAVGPNGEDFGDKLFNAAGFMKVDGNYTPKSYEEWTADDWPKTYRNPSYSNIFSAGIAFAPPHQISEPRKSPNGTVITPAPPRTGMPSAMMAEAVANSIVNLVKGKKKIHQAPMTRLGAACVASTGMGLFNGTSASMTMTPVVPDWQRYPETGREKKLTFGEIGLAGHWVKYMLHILFIYKAKARPFYYLIPG
jgi:sulfide:quinone oxidoreductase